MNVGKLNQILTKLILIQFNKNWLFAMKYTKNNNKTKQIVKLSKIYKAIKRCKQSRKMN